MASSRPEARLYTTLAVGAAVTAWAYGPTLADTVERWRSDPQYSHGFLVPLFSLYLLWRRRGVLAGADPRPRWWGVGVVLVGLGLWLLSFYAYQPWLDAGSMVVVLLGLVAAAGGRRGLLWGGPAVLFLAFMIPLPYQLQTMLGSNLQRLATVCSTYLLQTVGIPAVAQGNIILLSNEPVGVAAACSGLSMLVTFFALSAAVAIVMRGGWLERAVVVASAIPIAVATNVLRITVTGALYEYNHGETARFVFHDGAGYLMPAVGLLMLLGVQHVFGRAVVPADRSGRPARRPAAPARPAAAY